MARTKGSRNRATLVRALQDLGRKESFDGWDHTSLQAELEREKTKTPVAPEPEPPRVIIDAEVAKGLVAETRRRMDLMVAYYCPDGDESEYGRTGEEALIPDRIQETLRRVFFVSNEEEAGAVVKRTMDKLHVHLLKLWGDGSITGPATIENIAKRIKKAESLAKFMDKQNKPEAAVKYRERARLISLESGVEKPRAAW